MIGGVRVPISQHINYSHAEFRGTNLYLNNMPRYDTLWNHCDANRPALEVCFAHLAKLGVNMVRVYAPTPQP